MNVMKVIFTITLMMLLTSASAQIYYDNGPIIAPSKPLDNGFQIQGNKWNKSCISYMLVTGTDDIAGNDERVAISQAFQLWQSQTSLIFKEVYDENDADIRIRWAPFEHGDPCPCSFDGTGGILAHGFFPPPNFDLFAGDLHFDDSEAWTLSTRSGGSEPIDLVTVAAHEIGHSLGLNHSSVSGSLMNPVYSGSHRFLAQDDIDGIQSLYGRPIVITGPPAVCTTAIFTVSNLPSSMGVTWASSNSNGLPIDSNTGVVTRLNNFNSLVNISATLNGDCGTLQLQPVSVWVGKPNFQIKLTSDYNYVYADMVGVGAGINSQNITSTSWLTLSGSGDGVFGGNGFEGAGHGPGNSWLVKERISATNLCGTTSIDMNIQPAPPLPCPTYADNYSIKTIGKNSFTTDLVINPCNESASLVDSQPLAPSVIIYTAYGDVVWKASLTSNSWTVENVRPGIYIMRVSVNNEIITKRIVIE